MKIVYQVPFEDGPPWLERIEIERQGDDIVFSAIKRNENVLACARIPITKLERMTERLKEED